MSAIKFGESLSKFMIPIALLEKSGSLTFITGIEINHMTRHSSKPNKLRNINPVRYLEYYEGHRISNANISVTLESM